MNGYSPRIHSLWFILTRRKSEVNAGLLREAGDGPIEFKVNLHVVGQTLLSFHSAGEHIKKPTADVIIRHGLYRRP